MSLKNKAKMKRQQSLNELIIVNPGNPDDEDLLSLGQISSNDDDIQYLGRDGMLYRAADFGINLAISSDGIGLDTNSIGTYFLGGDGTLYQILKT